MPLVVLCGIPGSGKTTRSRQLQQFLAAKHQCKVVVVNEQSLGLCKRQAYQTSQDQKVARARIKFEVQKNLQEGVVVIADSVNYIKGYRYQMYCIAREAKTTYCVLFCNTPLENALLFNSHNDNNFRPDMVQELSKRMETPHLKNRWDVPLFERRPEQETPLMQIAQTLLFEAKRAKDPTSTKQDEKLSQDYLYQLDKICQSVCEEVTMGKLKTKNTWSALDAKKAKHDFTCILRQKPQSLHIIRQSFLQFILEADKRK